MSTFKTLSYLAELQFAFPELSNESEETTKIKKKAKNRLLSLRQITMNESICDLLMQTSLWLNYNDSRTLNGKEFLKEINANQADPLLRVNVLGPAINDLLSGKTGPFNIEEKVRQIAKQRDLNEHQVELFESFLIDKLSSMLNAELPPELVEYAFIWDSEINSFRLNHLARRPFEIFDYDLIDLMSKLVSKVYNKAAEWCENESFASFTEFMKIREEEINMMKAKYK